MTLWPKDAIQTIQGIFLRKGEVWEREEGDEKGGEGHECLPRRREILSLDSASTICYPPTPFPKNNDMLYWLRWLP